MKLRQIRRRRAHAHAPARRHQWEPYPYQIRWIGWIGQHTPFKRTIEPHPDDPTLAVVTDTYHRAATTGLGIYKAEVGRVDHGITIVEHDGTKVWVP